MSEPELTEEQRVEATDAYAAEQLASGVTAERVTANLLERGLDSESATAVVNNVVEGWKSGGIVPRWIPMPVH